MAKRNSLLCFQLKKNSYDYQLSTHLISHF